MARRGSGMSALIGAIGIEPGAVEALDGESVVGDGRDHGRKDAARAVVAAVEAGRVETQACLCAGEVGDAAFGEVRGGVGAGDRPRHGP